MSVGGVQGAPRRWIVRRADYLQSVTAAGMTLRMADAAAVAVDAQGRPKAGGGYVMVQSDSDPRRYPWGLLSFPVLREAWEMDAAPDAGLFGVPAPSLFA